MKSMKDNETLQVIVKQDSSGHRLDLFIQNQTEEIQEILEVVHINLLETQKIQILEYKKANRVGYGYLHTPFMDRQQHQC